MKLNCGDETDYNFALHKFYNNLELKERLFTDARNHSFFVVKNYSITVLQKVLFKTEDL